MKMLLSIIFLFITLISSGQSLYDKNSISNKTKKIVNKIIKINELMDSAVYGSGIRPKQWDNFEELKNVATKNELIVLTNHPNGVVRCYSFWALTSRKDVNLFSFVKDHLTDDELVNTQFGCIGGKEMVGDFFIQQISIDESDLETSTLNINEYKELDSLLIYKPNKLASQYYAILRAEPTEMLYPKIKELVVNKNNPSALITLAKYQKTEDIETIKNFKEITKDEEDGYIYTYRAISEFPRLEFLQLLEENLKKTLDKTHYSNEWRELYRTIASFKNIKALELLKIPFTNVQHQNIKKYHISFVFQAISEFNDPIYDELLWKIWEEEKFKTIGLKSYKYLLNQNSSKAYELTKREFIDDYQVQKSDFIPNLNNIENSDVYYDYLLNIIKANDKEFYNYIINQKIENENVNDLPLYTSKVNKQKIFIKSLFNRIEKDSNAHVYLNIIKTLIEFKDENINKEILEVRKRNNSMNENWGGKALDELLEENNIK
jgi:hypothetical protein